MKIRFEKLSIALAIIGVVSTGGANVHAVGYDATTIAGSNGWGSSNDPEPVYSYWDNLGGAMTGNSAINPKTGVRYTMEEVARMTYNTYVDLLNTEVGVGTSNDQATRNRDIDVMRSSNTQRIEQLEARLGTPGVTHDEFNKGISRVAALAGLHPLDF